LSDQGDSPSDNYQFGYTQKDRISKIYNQKAFRLMKMDPERQTATQITGNNNSRLMERDNITIASKY